jgi:outer membrane protein assembly factor BamB
VENVSVNKKVKSLVAKISSSSNSSTKHKRYWLSIITILIIAVILASSFLVLFSDKQLFTLSTSGTKPNIPTISSPYTTPELLWKTEIPGGHDVYPVVLNDVAYAYRDYNTKGDILTALNVTNGYVIWEKSGHTTIDVPAYDINSIIYTPMTMGLTVWNAEDGTKIWHDWTTGLYSVTANGIVYAIGDTEVVALKAIDGTKLWKHTFDHWLWSAPAVANGTVYISANNVNKVYALDALKGKLLWERTINDDDTYSKPRSPVVANGVVYVVDVCTLYALNAQTGEKMWTYKTGGEVGSPVVEYGVVYVGSGDKKVYALNAQTGKKIWTYNIGPDGMSVPGVPSPAVADGIVYVTDNRYANGVLYALSAANGKKLWSYQQIDEMIYSHVIVDNKIYLTANNSMYAFSTIKPLGSVPKYDSFMLFNCFIITCAKICQKITPQTTLH